MTFSRPEEAGDAAGGATRPAASPRRRRGLRDATGPLERGITGALFVLALVPTAALLVLGYELVTTAYPAIVFNGWAFFTTKTFTLGNLYGGALQVHHGYSAPAGASYGVLPLLFGTVVSSVIALVIAVPVAVGTALVLAEKTPKVLQEPVGVILDLLAGIPSVIFGLWGIYTFGPAMSHTVYAWIAGFHIPYLDGPTGAGEGLLTGSLVLAVMIVPIITAVTRELIRSVPVINKEGATAMGLTTSETTRVVTLPFIRTGIVAAAMLGLARALGETIAILIISGNALNTYPQSIFDPFSTMASTIAAILDGALTDSTGMAVHSLAEVALVLMVLTLLANLGGRLISRRISGGSSLPVGRGV